MTKSVCAFQTRNIRYIVDGQAFKVQHFVQQTRNIRYSIDSQGLRHDHFLAAESQ
jgi:hypothetical protein